jgi:hypothetical protein
MTMNAKAHAAAAITAAALLAACSSGGGATGSGGSDTGTGATGTTSTGSGATGTGGHDCALYQEPAGTDLSTPVESFKTNVMAIFAENCASSSCHGATPPTGNLSLGGTEAAAPATYKALVNVMSGELTTMPYVTPSMYEESYLMHKLDADQCYYDEQCVGHLCLAAMPNLGTTLPTGTRDIVRRWIFQGAMNN